MKRAFLPKHAVALLAAGLLLLTSCELSCPANVTAPPQVILAFSTDTLTSTGVGFRRAELRSAYLVRYGSADFQSLIDTLRQPTPATATSTKPVFPIFYSSGYPPQFALSDYVSQNVLARSFRLMVPAANRTYDITNLVLKQEPGKNRCDGYRLTQREAIINGQRRDGLNSPPELIK